MRSLLLIGGLAVLTAGPASAEVKSASGQLRKGA